MSRFYVGQRVRIKFCFNAHIFGDCSGKEATIISSRLLSKGLGWVISIDGEPALRCDGFPHCALSEQLEPITDCYDKTTWDTCIWKPEHLRVPA